MRNFLSRPTLSDKALTKLSEKTTEISSSPDPKKRAEDVYKASRTTVWFERSVLVSLRTLAGPGERCMFCGSSEASQVDHFKPKADFPHLAMEWENYIWICGVCNLNKGDNFPIGSGGTQLLINPIDEDVWQYFSIDDTGYIMCNWDVANDDFDARAKTSEDIYKFNRQAIQEARQKQINSLKEQVLDCITLEKYGHITKIQLKEKLQRWIEFPFHPEVSQYYLKGAGKVEGACKKICVSSPGTIGER
ncbi:HNH endonuclease [Undibacterium sp. TC9W]|uniref:HNH endonuclease n=1 Tax=Undibacterium sp. TC9W TaxID=3413053 RepID=UPI003BF20DC3